MSLPPNLDERPAAALKELVIRLLGEVSDLKQTVAELRAEVARLKGLKGPPSLKPSGMDQATDPARPRGVKAVARSSRASASKSAC